MIQSKKYYVAPLNSSKANKFTSFYHYSGVGFKKASLNLGIFRKEDNLLVGVSQWGCSFQEKIRLDRYVKEPINKSQYLELNRFCMADSEGKNSESQGISLSIKWIKQNRSDIKLLVSYAGRKEGNYGYIYQATNWTYLGYFISDGFYRLDDYEKHKITLSKQFKVNKLEGETLNSYLCRTYNKVIKTKSKQFIYVILLDKHLSLASSPLPYPKPLTDYPIVTEEEILQNKEKEIKEKEIKENPKFYYEEGETLFSLRARQRQAIRKNSIEDGLFRPCVACYNNKGELIQKAENVSTLCKAIKGLNESGVRKAIKTKTLYKGYFFQTYSKFSEPQLQIEVKGIAQIEDTIFFKQSEIANYIGVSRQAISSAYKNHSSKIKNFEIIWL